jgi:hypothetical protein
MKSNFIRVSLAGVVTVLALGYLQPVRAAAPERLAVPPAPDKPVAAQFSGMIIAVNADTALLTVKGTAVSQTFKVAPDAPIITKEKPQGTLADLKIDDKVEVVYRVDDHGVLTAMRVEVLSP